MTATSHLLHPQVVLAGGSCKIPRLQQMLREEFPSSEVLTSIAPDEVVVVGCAVEAGILGVHQGEEGDADSGMVPCTPEDVWVVVSVCVQISPVLSHIALASAPLPSFSAHSSPSFHTPRSSSSIFTPPSSCLLLASFPVQKIGMEMRLPSSLLPPPPPTSPPFLLLLPFFHPLLSLSSLVFFHLCFIPLYPHPFLLSLLLSLNRSSNLCFIFLFPHASPSPSPSTVPQISVSSSSSLMHPLLPLPQLFLKSPPQCVDGEDGSTKQLLLPKHTPLPCQKTATMLLKVHHHCHTYVQGDFRNSV